MSVKIEKKEGLIEVVVDLSSATDLHVYKTHIVEALLKEQGYKVGHYLNQPHRAGVRNDLHSSSDWPISGKWVFEDLDYNIVEEIPVPPTVEATPPVKVVKVIPASPAVEEIKTPEPAVEEIKTPEPAVKKKKPRRRTKKTTKED